ncbi:MAG: hypothetical protein IPO24_08555 [Bacteroidetes bacterium]|jgi:hypothetical protein|nr:hypothetical protein [Bacteroidota bacterium]
MKNYTLLLAFICIITSVTAQVNNQAIGVRLGGGDGVESEISYQQYIGGPNRLEFDLGFFDNGWDEGFKFTMLYQWVGNIEGGFNWYAGAGGSIGGRDIDNNDKNWNDDSDDGLFLNVDGQLGIEYNFSVPFQLSFDARPEFGLINDDFDFGYGLGIRYTF